MFKAITGTELKTIAFGKPQLGTFTFATRLLQQWRKDTHGINKPPATVYFVGDTPESDIRGTNEFDESDQATCDWHSILVRTGVFREGTKPAYMPKMTVDKYLTLSSMACRGNLTRKMKDMRLSSEAAPPAIYEDQDE